MVSCFLILAVSLIVLCGEEFDFKTYAGPYPDCLPPDTRLETDGEFFIVKVHDRRFDELPSLKWSWLGGGSTACRAVQDAWGNIEQNRKDRHAPLKASVYRVVPAPSDLCATP